MITRIKAEISLSSSPNPLPSSKRVVGERLIFIRPRPHHGTRYLSRTTTTSGLQGSSSAVQTPQARLQLPSLGARARVPNELDSNFTLFRVLSKFRRSPLRWKGARRRWKPGGEEIVPFCD